MSIEKKTFRSGPYADFIAQGVQVGNILYLAGQVGIDSEGNIPADIGGQARIAYANLKEVLAEFGADMSNVVEETFL